MDKFEFGAIFPAISKCHNCHIGAEIKDGKLFCTKNNQEIHFFKPGFTCPDGQWKAMEHASYMRIAPRRERGVWSQIKDTWQKLEEMVDTVTSGYVDVETFNKRKLSCYGNGTNVKPCINLMKTNGHDYCGACGCGQWLLARLDNKLKFKDLPCPLKKSGFANEEGTNGTPAPTQ